MVLLADVLRKRRECLPILLVGTRRDVRKEVGDERHQVP
jgi:hypothetical protein